MNAELPRRVGSGRDHAALIGTPAHYYGLALERWIVELFHGDEEGVHIEVEVSLHVYAGPEFEMNADFTSASSL
jgi:hypothetical protein